MQQVSTELQQDHETWLNRIRQWESEIQNLEAQNGEIARRSNAREFQKQVEHWQNQFIVQKNRLDQMKHNIKLFGGDREKGERELNEYEGYYNELRKEFETFSGGS